MSLASQHKKTVLSHGEPRDAAVNFDIELYNKSIMEHLRRHGRIRWRQSQQKTQWISFRGHSRSRILGSL